MSEEKSLWNCSVNEFLNLHDRSCIFLIIFLGLLLLFLLRIVLITGLYFHFRDLLICWCVFFVFPLEGAKKRSKLPTLRVPEDSLFGLSGHFLYCCPDCPAHLNSIGSATPATWAAIKKYLMLLSATHIKVPIKVVTVPAAPKYSDYNHWLYISLIKSDLVVIMCIIIFHTLETSDQETY